MSMKKAFKYLSGYLYLALLYSLLPIAYLKASWQHRLGESLGLLLLKWGGRVRQITEINLSLAFPEHSAPMRAHLLRENFKALGVSCIEMIALVHPRKKSLLKRLDAIQGLEALTETLEQGHSVLLLFPHLISVYFAGYLLQQKTQLPFGILYNPPRNAVIEKFLQKKIERFCSPVFTREHFHRLIKHLHQPNILWYSPDLDLGRKRSFFIDFFGHTAATGSIPHTLIQKTGAKPFTIAFYRNEQGHYTIHLHALLGFGQGKVEDDLKHLNERIETIVKPHPEQYLWQYKRYQTRPQREAKLYPRKKALV